MWKTYWLFSCSFRCAPVVKGICTIGVNCFLLIMKGIVVLSTICTFRCKYTKFIFFSSIFQWKSLLCVGIKFIFCPSFILSYVFPLRYSSVIHTVFHTFLLYLLTTPLLTQLEKIEYNNESFLLLSDTTQKQERFILCHKQLLLFQERPLQR